MCKSLESIQTMREQVLSRYVYAAAILGIFPLTASLTMAIHAGWNPANYMHVCAYAFMVACAALRRHLPFCFRAMLVLAIVLGLAIAGMLSWGLGPLGTTLLLAF